ncbi:hypothetical protein JCM19046_4322 [Bacillus sp. JCM 19046]|nr:hypothetical protein JCM19045_3234 [Bacillus sp. JCM 19045]GAF19656.1 hypothetical protein JCM19046_4322 [Bacillus sp. JCM 19046]
MVYWGEGLRWYVNGVMLTYLVWLCSIILFVVSFRKTRGTHSLLAPITLLLQVAGFLWTTFVLIAGLSQCDVIAGSGL